MHTIPAALQDRMEVIRLSGYTELEKLEIAKRFLVRKQMEQTGLSDKQVQITDEGLSGLIQYYTRESGVRNLEREIGNLCRKMARKVVNHHGRRGVRFRGDRLGAMLPELLGPWKFRDTDDGQEERNRRGHGSGLDGSRRPDSHYRSHPHGRQGQADGHRQAGRRDAGIGAGGDELCAVAGASDWVCRAISIATWTSTCTFPKARFRRTALRRGSLSRPPSAAR